MLITFYIPLAGTLEINHQTITYLTQVDSAIALCCSKEYQEGIRTTTLFYSVNTLSKSYRTFFKPRTGCQEEDGGGGGLESGRRRFGSIWASLLLSSRRRAPGPHRLALLAGAGVVGAGGAGGAEEGAWMPGSASCLLCLVAVPRDFRLQ